MIGLFINILIIFLKYISYLSLNASRIIKSGATVLQTRNEKLKMVTR